VNKSKKDEEKEQQEINRFMKEQFKDSFIEKGSSIEDTKLTEEGKTAVNKFFKIQNISDPKHMVLLKKIINSVKK
jgi:hypothetical protein